MVHAENGDLIAHNVDKLLEKGVTGPEGHMFAREGELEAQAVHTAITIAETVNTPLYVVHLMKKSAAQEIRRAKKKGYVVYGESLAAGLGTDGTHYLDKCWDKAAGHIMSPALDFDKSTKEF
jgi:dihydroorotase-like cyclic amidohydrolase